MTRIHSQRGATLIVALVLVLMIMLLALTAYMSSKVNLVGSGNVQSRGEAMYAAQEAIEAVISSVQFTSTPENALPSPCGAANTACSDFTRDGTPEYTTRIDPVPACIKSKNVSPGDLNLANNEELACAAGQIQQFGVSGVDIAAGNSLCADTTWQITAQTTSTRDPTKVTVTQGVAVRVSADALATSCL